jgi:nitroimidazol reductase NimA-like FMN-containing flavoprotein (pyridoxamine 5'-phosphate oxidase superfamily)
MDTQELNDELGNLGAVALQRSSPLCRLAYLGHDGLPRVIPIGFYWNGKRIVVCTATTAPKVRALESRPEVALTIDEGSESGNAKSLQLRGQATLETVDGVPDEYLEAASKSLGGAAR